MLATADPLADFGRFLRLYTAEGDASPHTIRCYRTNAAQFVTWCQERDVNAATATDGDVVSYRKALVDAGYSRGTVAVKLASVRRLFEALVWRGLRADNPAAGVKAPRDRTAREERVKFLPLDGLRRLLNAPEGDGPQARRDRAMLALMGVHGLRVAEVAALQVGDLDLEAGTVKVTGKGSKTRTVYLVPSTAAVLADWLEMRGEVAQEGEPALFVSLGNRASGRALTARAIRARVDLYLGNLDLKRRGVSCHSLRHSAATWARFAGAEPEAVQAALGHASAETTNVYTRLVARMQQNPALALEGLLG